MNAFDVVGDPVRRRLIELLAEREQSAGELTLVVRNEFGISQPAVSQHLRVLRENGFATVRPDRTRRLYAIAPERFDDIDAWVDQVKRHWQPTFDAISTEVARGKKKKKGKG